MPFIERDPWRMQYFRHVDCPDDVVIPTDDETAYVRFPAQRWVYDKLRICETQHLRAAPHGVMPDAYPVFSKPIYNLHGMGVGSRAIATPAAMEAAETPGHFWMPLLHGEHLSSDVAVVDGVAAWWRHTVGVPLDGGRFDYWTILADGKPSLEAACGAWLRTWLAGYTGAVNLETIGGRIIEVHLRFADQWPDLYGDGWLEAIVRLYRDGVWRFDDRARRDGYSVVLFGPHGRRYVPPPPEAIEVWRHDPGISSVQITFHPEVAPERHAMPPGGFRLAVVNAWQLDAALAVREDLAAGFGVPLPADVAVSARTPRRLHA